MKICLCFLLFLNRSGSLAAALAASSTYSSRHVHLQQGGRDVSTERHFIRNSTLRRRKHQSNHQHRPHPGLESRGGPLDHLHPVVEEFSRLRETAVVSLLAQQPVLRLVHLCRVDVDERLRFFKRSHHEGGQPANRLSSAQES